MLLVVGFANNRHRFIWFIEPLAMRYCMHFIKKDLSHKNSWDLEFIKKSLGIMMVFLLFRTKWKRQTAVGLELLAEAGNYAAFQRLYGGYWAGVPAYPTQPAPSADLYYRQAAATAAAAASASANTLQKPLPYRWVTPY